MADVIFVAIIVAFFTVAALFVRACDHIIGAEAEAVGRGAEPAPTQAEAA